MPQAAAGFAVDLDNLAWALASAGQIEAPELRVLVAAAAGAGAGQAHELCSLLRARSIRCAAAPTGDAAAYGRAWHYSHLVELSGTGARCIGWPPEGRSR